MCFADHLNSLLMIFCSLSFILSLLLCFVQNLFLKLKATQNTSAFMYSILTYQTYQIKFPLHSPVY